MLNKSIKKSIELSGYLVLSACILTGCNQVDQQEIDYSDANIKRVEINKVDFLNDVKVSDLVSTYEYVPLETTNESLLGDITSFMIFDERIFVHDRTTSSIVIFSLNGDFLAKIKEGGNGPGELSRIESFTIDRDQKQLIIGSSGKISFFDFEGNYISEFKTILGNSIQLAYTGKGILMAFTSYIQLVEEQGYNHLVFIDLKSEKIISKSIPFNKLARLENMTLFYNSVSYTNKESVLLSIPYKNYIWEVSGTEVKPFIYLDFGNQALPRNFEDEYLTNPRYNSSQLRDFETSQNYLKLYGGGALINDNYVNFTYTDNVYYYEVYYDLKNGKAFQIPVPIENDIDGSKYVIHRFGYKDDFVSLSSASGLIERSSNGEITDPNLLQKLKNITDVENPVLRFLSYKK